MQPGFVISRHPAAFASPRVRPAGDTVPGSNDLSLAQQNTIDLMNPTQNPKAPLLTAGTGSPGGITAPVPRVPVPPSTGMSRTTMIVGGIAIVAAIGAAVYFSTRS